MTQFNSFIKDFSENGKKINSKILFHPKKFFLKAQAFKAYHLQIFHVIKPKIYSLHLKYLTNNKRVKNNNLK